MPDGRPRTLMDAFNRGEDETGVQTKDIIAIDGGGTKTLLLRVASDGSVVTARRAGGSNPFDVPDWRKVIAGLMEGQQSQLAAAAFGMAGFGESERLNAELAAAYRQLCPVQHSLHNDADMACRGAFMNRAGVLLLSGTGSMAWGMAADGQTTRIGGWGSLFGDEGSGYWIGRFALSVLSQMIDGRHERRDDFLIRFAAARRWPGDSTLWASSLYEWYASLTEQRPAVAALTAEISRFAEQGCETSRDILRHAAKALSRHVVAARHALGASDLPWSYGGGTLRSPILRENLSQLLGAPLVPRLPPIGGAVLVAAQLAGWHVNEGFVDTLSLALERQI